MSANDKNKTKQSDIERKRQPDPDDAWDPTGYYRRKEARTDRDVKGCIWITIGMLIAALVATLAKHFGQTWPT